MADRVAERRVADGREQLDPAVLSETWVQLLTQRAQSEDCAPAYTFLADGEQDERTLSYGALDRSARALAALLQDGSCLGERALLLLPPGPEFVVAFFGCLYAGMIAVPAPLPTRARGLPRLLAIASDCRPSVVLGGHEFTRLLAGAAEDAALTELGRLRFVDVAAVPAQATADFRASAVNAQTVAFLQYTSGSTGTPRGVALTHENLLHNERAIQRAFQHTKDSVVVGWLPPFHDMGLIGNLLQPLFVGARSVQMAPAHFLTKPRRWLDAISRYRATTSGGPNFAYDLCVDKIPASEREALDLRAWQVAFNGAEPVRAATLARFAEAFAVAGFRAGSFYPCYGLAEATLLVSGGSVCAAPVVRSVDRARLEQGQLLPASASEQSDVSIAHLPLVGAGRAYGVALQVVDPERSEPCAEGAVGEIWVAGASVAAGYWGRPEDSASTFGARLKNGEGPFLRTGDLGGFWQGELFVTGRLKDLIIVRGRNLYPQDLEQAAEESDPKLARGGAAAFAIAREHDGDEQVVIVQEVSAREPAECERLARAIAHELGDRFELAVHAVALIRRGSLPRTTSGKVRRRACRERFLTGSLDLVWSSAWNAPGAGVASPDPSSSVSGQITASAVADQEGARGSAAQRLASELSSAGAPQSDLERGLAAIWAEVLERPALAREADFLSLGGDSLKALQVSARVSDELGYELSPAQLFETCTIASLATFLQAEGSSGAVELRAEPSAGELSAQLPLSRAQERLWFLQQLVADKPVYHIAGALRFEGALDVSALERGLALLTARHAALRTCFHLERGGPVQRIEPPRAFALPLRCVPDCDAAARALLELRQPFELAVAPVRWLLLRVGEREHVLGFSCHHLIADGWSMTILVRELMAAYRAFARGAQPELSALPPYLTQQLRAEQKAEEPHTHAAALDHWRAQFARPLAPLELPTDRPRAARPSYAGARAPFVLPEALSARLAELGRSLGATPFMTFLAGLSVLLHRYAGQNDLCVGAPVALRSQRALEGAVGCFLNTLALRVDLSGNPEVRELVARARRSVQGAQRHAQLPFERVLQASRAERGGAHASLFQVMLSQQPALPRLPELEDLRVSIEQLDTGTAQFDLSLDLIPAADGGITRAAWEYDTDLFDATTIEQFTRHFVRVLEAMVARPSARISELALVTESERAGIARAPLAAGWEHEVETGHAPLLPVHMLFEIEAQRRPEQEAVVGAEERLSYAELNERANRLARHLRQLGVRPELRVGLYLERSPALVVAALAVLKAGGCYVPIDPAQPCERAALMIADAEVMLLVTSAALAAALPDTEPKLVLIDRDAAQIAAQAEHDPSFAGSMHQLAYVLYTSGSTGQPKGVMVTQRSLAQTFLAWRAVYLDDLLVPAPTPAAGGARAELVRPELRLLQLASPAFDVWTADWVRALCAGGTLVIAAREAALDATELTRVLRAERVSAVDLVPAFVPALLAAWRRDGAPASLRLLVVGSDVWSLRDYQALRAGCPPEARLVSCYGVTEATIDSAWFEQAPGAYGVSARSVPLGWSFPGTRLYVLDQAGQLVPNGAPGELAIAGASLARGYVRQPARSAERFLPDPFAREPGARLYRTGDRVRAHADGTLEFLGRLDQQLKLRGVRIELAEIEACLRLHADVREAAVALRGSTPEQRALVAYVVLADGRSLDVASLRAHLRAHLPEVMVPAAFAQLAALPLSANGKVDRRALPEGDNALAELAHGAAHARTAQAHGSRAASDLEQTIAQVWCGLLSLEQVGLHDNFFDLGGHSLLLSELAYALHARLGRELSVVTLLEHPTVAAQAAALAGEGEPTPSRDDAPDDTRAERRAQIFARRRRAQESEP